MNEAIDSAKRFLQGRSICVAGRLLSLTHTEFRELVERCGGMYLARPRRCNFVLVLGDDAWPSQPNGAPPRALVYAERLQTLGFAVAILGEEEFLDRLGVQNETGNVRRFTIPELARLLDIRATRLRRWVQAGLLEPVTTSHRLAFFDFHQVTNARKLHELIQSGASLRDIRTGLERLRRWLPDEKLPLGQITRLAGGGNVIWRRQGKLYDGHGQQHFDFEADAGLLAIRSDNVTFVDELFAKALTCEDEGNFTQAEQLYEQAIAHAPTDSTLHFNLGNVRYSLGRYCEAATAYQAALRFDDDYVEAWNNLGNALAKLGRLTEAADAFRRALSIEPDYNAAHDNLADILKEWPRSTEAASDRRKSLPAPTALCRRWLRIADTES